MSAIRTEWRGSMQDTTVRTFHVSVFDVFRFFLVPFFRLAVVQFGRAVLEKFQHVIHEAQAVAGMIEYDAFFLVRMNPQTTPEKLDVFRQRIAQRPGHDDTFDVRAIPDNGNSSVPSRDQCRKPVLNAPDLFAFFRNIEYEFRAQRRPWRNLDELFVSARNKEHCFPRLRLLRKH